MNHTICWLDPVAGAFLGAGLGTRQQRLQPARADPPPPHEEMRARAIPHNFATSAEVEVPLAAS